MQIREIQRNKATARIYFIMIMHYGSICEVGVLRRGIRNSAVSLASNLVVYNVRTGLKGILTHSGRGHLNCLNARSRGLNNLNQLLYCVSLNIYNKFVNYFCELKFSGNTHQRP